MADKFPFFAAESATWKTTSPNPHIDLSGTALTLGTYPSQTFKAAADDATLDFASTNTCTIVVWKDATNWKRYEKAVWTDAATDTLDLSAATLMGAAGTISNDDAVSVVASLPKFSAGTSLDLTSANVLNNPAMTAGFINRTDTTLSFATNTFTLTKVNNYRVWANSVAYDFTATQTEAIADATNFYYIYFDANGDLVDSTTAWDIAGGGAPCATLYYNSSYPAEYVLSDERHSYLRNPVAHKQQHQSVGAYWISGLAGTFGDTNGSISIATGTYADEDIVLSFTGPITTASEVYRDASGWRVDAAGADIRKQSSGKIQYDNAGTLADVDSTNYVNYWVYATNTVDAKIHVLVGQAQFATDTAAIAEVPDSLTLPPWLNAEGRLLYRITYRRTVAVPAGDIYQVPTDFRRVKISGGTTLTGAYLSTGLPDGQILVGNASGTATAVTMSGDVTLANTGAATVANVQISAINLDGGTDIGDALVDADLILVDDGAGGTNRKATMSRVKTYIGAATTATKLDDFATPDDNTDLNASTSAHGLAPKAVAPAAGLLNVVGIANGETVYANKTLPNLAAVTVQASADIAAGDLVNLYTATGALRAQKADGGGTTKPANGYALGAITSGNSGAIYAGGIVSGLTDLTPGGDCWLSQATAGAVTQTAPNEATTGKLIQLVGKSISASTMLFQPGPSIIT